MSVTAELLITGYAVMMGNLTDKELLTPGVAEHVRRTGQVPKGVATDRGFWVATNERPLKTTGVQKVSLPKNIGAITFESPL